MCVCFSRLKELDSTLTHSVLSINEKLWRKNTSWELNMSSNDLLSTVCLLKLFIRNIKPCFEFKGVTLVQKKCVRNTRMTFYTVKNEVIILLRVHMIPPPWERMWLLAICTSTLSRPTADTHSWPTVSQCLPDRAPCNISRHTPFANNVAMATFLPHSCMTVTKQQWVELCQSRLHKKVTLHLRAQGKCNKTESI